eukprot:2302324-Pleurochrysis_carterae.AAC.2
MTAMQLSRATLLSRSFHGRAPEAAPEGLDGRRPTNVAGAKLRCAIAPRPSCHLGARARRCARALRSSALRGPPLLEQ